MNEIEKDAELRSKKSGIYFSIMNDNFERKRNGVSLSGLFPRSVAFNSASRETGSKRDLLPGN